MKLKGISNEGLRRIAQVSDALDVFSVPVQEGSEVRYLAADGLVSIDRAYMVEEGSSGNLIVETEQSEQVFEVDSQTGQIIREL